MWVTDTYLVKAVYEERVQAALQLKHDNRPGLFNVIAQALVKAFRKPVRETAPRAQRTLAAGK
jgi:hypothetical protein